jgi:hypothetical protein
MITNTDTALLYLLQAQFGGSVSVRKAGSKPGWKPSAAITWTNRGALNVLEKTRKYLIAKRLQADLCIELIRMRDASIGERHDIIFAPTPLFPNRHFVRMKPEIQAKQNEIAAKISVLNRKGVAN